MRLLKYLTVALLLSVASVTPARAEIISGTALAIAGWLTAEFGITSTTAFYAIAATAEIAINVAVAVGAGYVSSELQGKTKGVGNGVSGTLKGGGVVPQSIIVGRYATAGSLIYGGGWGQDGNVPNAYLTWVVELASAPITGLDAIWVGANKGIYNTGLTPDVNLGYPIAEFREGGRENLWVRFYDGTQTTADAALVARFGTDPAFPYTSAMKGIGIAYAIVTARFNPNVFGGWPQYETKFELRGMKLYDPRADTTVGGSGSQLFSDPSTWAYTENPKVMEYNIYRGISYGSEHLYGLQDMPAARVPLANWFAAMNECDAAFDDITGAPRAQFRAGLEIPLGAPPVETIEALNASCNGRTAEIGGVYKTIVSAAGSPVLAFTDSDIIVSEDQSLDPFVSIEDIVNIIAGDHPDPIEGWGNKDLPVRVNQASIDKDGERPVAVTYGAVTDPSQVQYLMEAALREHSNQRRHNLTLTPPFWLAEPLDVLSWTSTRNSYSSKSFLVLQVDDEDNLDVRLALVETDPSDYDFDPDTDYLPHTQVAVPVALPPPVLSDAGRVQLSVDDLRRQMEELAASIVRETVAQWGSTQNNYSATARAVNVLEQNVVIGQSAIARNSMELEARLVGADVTLAASVTTEQIARINADGVLASDITTLSTTVGSHTTTITSHTSSINGLNAQWGVTINVDGRVTGAVRLDGGASNSSFVVVADNFKIFPAGGSEIPMFEITASVAKFNVPLKASLVDTAALQANAATIHAKENFSGIVSTNDTSWNDLTATGITQTWTADEIEFDISVTIHNSDNGDHPAQLRLLEDGTAIKSWPSSGTEAFTAQKSGYSAPFPTAWHHTPSAGSHTYKIQWRNPSAGTTVLTAEGTLRADQIKR